MEDTMNNGKNNTLWIILAVGVLIVAVTLFVMNKKDADDVAVEDGSDSEVVDRNDVDGVEDISEGSVNASSPAVSLSYQQALVKYKDARIQLDKTCQASPDKMTFKNGTSIMIDNRAPVARTVKVGSTFSIKAYGFKIVKLSSDTIPATWLVDCDGSQNVSTILIQA